MGLRAGDLRRVLAAIRTCAACEVTAMEPLADLGAVPALSGVMFDDEGAALNSARGRMTLAHCPACCLVDNMAFDASLVPYDAEYDNSLHHSATFQAYTRELVSRLAHDYDLRGKHVVEIGSGKGHFLVELCRAAQARGTGYDPSYDGQVKDPAVSFVTDYLPWADAPPFDFFVMRHVLEHLPDPFGFLLELRRACGTRPVAGYVEVPDAIHDFQRSPWNCHYPHASYFSATALGRIAARAGFRVLRLVRSFDGQYLAVDLGANLPAPNQVVFGGQGLRSERAIIARFREQHATVIQHWRQRLDSIGYEACVLWGAGAKGLGFLNAVDPDRRLAAVVDLNPAKHGRFLPGTGHRVDPPTSLRGDDLRAVVVTNPSYRTEVERSLADLDVGAEVLCAH